MVESEKGLAFLLFCNLRPRNALLLQNSPKDQCNCLVQENFFLELEAIGMMYDSSLCSEELHNDCWLAACENCKISKNLVPLIHSTAQLSSQLRQWENVILENKCNGSENNADSTNPENSKKKFNEATDFL